MRAGLNDWQARYVAVSNNDLDMDLGAGWMPGIGDQSRHFNQLKPFMNGFTDSRDYWAARELGIAIQSYKNGNCDSALWHLGRGLHSIQDEYAHRNWDTGRYGVSQHPMWFDDWSDPRNSSARMLTEDASMQYIQEFLKRIGQQ